MYASVYLCVCLCVCVRAWESVYVGLLMRLSSGAVHFLLFMGLLLRPAASRRCDKGESLWSVSVVTALLFSAGCVPGKK